MMAHCCYGVAGDVAHPVVPGGVRMIATRFLVALLGGGASEGRLEGSAPSPGPALIVPLYPWPVKSISVDVPPEAVLILPVIR